MRSPSIRLEAVPHSAGLCLVMVIVILGHEVKLVEIDHLFLHEIE